MQENSPLPAEFRAYPGPLVRFDPEGRPEAWNGPGGLILDATSMAALAHIVAQSHERGAAATARISIGTGEDTRHFELTCLPQGDGGTLALGRDCTFDANVAAALSDSRQRYKDLADLAGDFAWETRPDGRLCFVSAAGALGHAAVALIGTDPVELLVDPASAPVPLPFRATRLMRDVEMWASASDGTPRCLQVSAVPIAPEGTAFAGARGICRDITAERRQHAHLAMRSQVTAYVIDAIRNEAAPQAMLDAAAQALGNALSADGCIIHMGAAGDAVRDGACFGTRPADGAVQAVLARLADAPGPIDATADDRAAIAIATRFRDRDNGAISAWRRTDQPPWGDEDRMLLAAIEAQVGIALHQIQDQLALETLSRTDPLTALLNRRAFAHDLDVALARSRRNRTPGALVYVDLDNFKAVNDTAGHEAGDAVLTEVADLLRHASRSYDLLARLGGDEFALWLDNADGKAARARAGQLLRSAECLRRHSARADAPLGISIGIAIFGPDSGEGTGPLMRRADRAMYQVKHGGKHAFAVLEPGERGTL